MHRFYRFRDSTDGSVDYYDEAGKSAQKFLVRKPVASGRFSSGFGMRRHPIVRRYRMHTGVDYAAPSGTRDHGGRQRRHREDRHARRLRPLHHASSTCTATRPPTTT